MRREQKTTRTGWTRKVILPAIPILIVGAILAGPARAVPPQTAKVNCDKGGRITSALENAYPGRSLVIVVSGACVENVLVARDDVTLIAEENDGAMITAADNANAAIDIRGQRVRIEGFDAIVGGLDGIAVSRGASADIIGNTIRNAVGPGNRGFGILLTGSSYARVEGNTITGNVRSGVLIIDTASANIFDNAISGNTEGGIVVSRSAQGDIDGNTITGNGTDGIGIFWNSNARISHLGGVNTIEGNGRHGINCFSNSSVDFRGAQNFGSGNTGLNIRIGGNCWSNVSP